MKKELNLLGEKTEVNYRRIRLKDNIFHKELLATNKYYLNIVIKYLRQCDVDHVEVIVNYVKGGYINLFARSELFS